MELTGALETPLLANIGTWLGFVLSLMIFSLIVGDNALARLAQHIVVGAAVGYATVLAWQHVLRPRLVTPLLEAPADHVDLWVPLLLGSILFIAGLLRTLDSTRRSVTSRWRRGVYDFGGLVAALMVGIAVAVSMVGVFQGTLIPQIWRTAVTGFAWTAAPFAFAMGLLTVAVTTGSLLQLQVDPARDLADQPAWVRAFLLAWMGIGKRALWLTAGVLFARLMLARLSLLIARMNYFLDLLQTANIWRWAESLWRQIAL